MSGALKLPTAVRHAPPAPELPHQAGGKAGKAGLITDSETMRDAETRIQKLDQPIQKLFAPIQEL